MGVVRHVFVDELQDLVGSRVAFVRALLDASDHGFTLFLDRAQSIYEFQLDDGSRDDRKLEREDLISSLLTSGAVEETFSSNFRAKTARARSALPFGPDLAGIDPDYDRLDYELHNLLLDLPTNRIDEAVQLCKAIPKSSAIL